MVGNLARVVMQIENHFAIKHSPEQVWAGLSDIHVVADCLPGASVSEKLSESVYRGAFAVKLGPLAATFNGELKIEHNAENHTASVSGQGTDSRSGSRAQASLNYQILPSQEGHSEVQITTDLTLAGALAQFGKAAIIQQVADRITAQFVEAFEAHLANNRTQKIDEAPHSDPSAQSAPPLDAGRLFVSVIRDTLCRWWRTLSGRR
ncbi:MAG: SRPBCC family protein [Pseudomonadota bacterium]|jgi:carbon-monoxide dehydrogenase small subunit|nr:SRPBCC family protein [Pseudomonadota bacterium]